MKIKSPSAIQSLSDAVPFIVLVAFWIVIAWIGATSTLTEDVFALLVALCFFSPLATGIWALISMTGQIGRLCTLERREELALTQLDPADWLRANLRRRLIGLLAVPALNLVVTLPAMLGWSVLLGVTNRDMGIVLVALLFSYFLGAMQICAICVTLMGIFEMIQRSCGSSAREIHPIQTAVKWSLVLILTPIAVIASGVVTVGITTLILPVVLCVYYPRRTLKSWQESIKSYFTFG